MANKRFVKKIQQSAEFQSWPDNYHEIHNDTDHLLVFDYIHEWLKKLKNNS